MSLVYRALNFLFQHVGQLFANHHQTDSQNWVAFSFAMWRITLSSAPFDGFDSHRSNEQNESNVSNAGVSTTRFMSRLDMNIELPMTARALPVRMRLFVIWVKP